MFAVADRRKRYHTVWPEATTAAGQPATFAGTPAPDWIESSWELEAAIA